MKLALLSDPTTFVQLQQETLWKDEFEWSPSAPVSEYSLSGALIVDYPELKQAGRPFTLQPPDEEMAWLPRAQVKMLFGWAAQRGLKMKLSLEYADDAREFVVAFRANEEELIEADPVKGFPGFADDDWYRVTIKLMEVTED